MRIFIAFADADQNIADGAASALVSEGHTVVHPVLAANGKTQASDRVRALRKANFLVHLLSPEATAAGCQSLSDVLAFQKRWRSPRERILPVYTRGVDLGALPTVIQALQPQTAHGNLLADISNLIARRRAPSVRRQRLAAAAAGLCTVLAAVIFLANRPVTTTTIETPDFVVTSADQFVYWGSKPKYGLKLDRPGATLDYTCELGKPTGPNIINAKSSIEDNGKALCKSINVEMAVGPFDGATEYGFQPAGKIPYTIRGLDNVELKNGAFDVIMSNSSIKLRLTGLARQSDTGWGGYFTDTNQTSNVQVVNDGNELKPPYSCSVTSTTGRVQSEGNGCSFKLSNAAEGSLKVTVTGSKPQPKLFAEFDLVKGK